MGQRARVAASAKRSPDVHVHVHDEMIYLPPNGVNVYYAKTARMRTVERTVNHAVASAGPEGPLEGGPPAPLMHPRAYITHKVYRFLVWSLVFCEWKDEEQRTRYYGFAAEDAAEIVESKSGESVKDQDATLIVPLSQRRDQGGSFYEQLKDARVRSLRARASLGNRKARGDAMAPFLAFFASVARHDDPVATETLLPIECIARAALVAHEHNEEKRRKAMALLAKQKSYSVQDEMTAWLVDIVCDVITFGGVFGYEAYRLVDYVVFLLARAMGTGIGRILSACLGENATMCFAIVILDLVVTVGTVLAPFMLGFSGAAIAVAVSSATGEAKARCKSNALDWLLGSLSNQMIRIVSTLLQKVAFSKNVDEIVAAATRMLELKNLWNLGTSIVFSELFSQMDGFVKREINKRFDSFGGRLAACVARLAVHFAMSTAIEAMSPELGGMYRRMLVPKWMNIAVMGAESAKAEEQRKLLDMAEKIERGEEIPDDTIRAAKAEVELATRVENIAKNRVDDDMDDIDWLWLKKKDTIDIDTNELKALEEKLRISQADRRTKTARLVTARENLLTSQGNLEKNPPAMKYYNERKAAYDNASKKADLVNSIASDLQGTRDRLAYAGKNPGNNESVDDLRKNVNEAEKEAAKATEESKIADEKDRYRHAAVRDREQQEAYDKASNEAKIAFNAAKSAYDEANKPTNGSTSNPPNGSAQGQNKSEDASAPNLDGLKTAMDEAEKAADAAKAKAEPSFMRKTITDLAAWWTGNSSEKPDSTKMGMAHFV